jgi:DNA ligase (NAD+)
MFAVKDIGFLKPAARKKFDDGRTKALTAPYWRKLHALGVDGLGMTLCQDVAAHWPYIGEALNSIHYTTDDVKKLRSENKDATRLQELIGPAVAYELEKFVQDNIAELEKLASIGFVLRRNDESNGPLAGKVFCITGTLTSGQRNDVHDKIIQAGGTVKTSVSKKVTHLVKGNEAGSSKVSAAAKYGTVVITEEELYLMMGEAIPEMDLKADKEY